MILQIKEPCKANWQNMSPQTGGRYCAQCDKVVKDFTQMNDAQVYEFVNQNRDTCGRFNQQQLNRTLLPKPTSTYRYKWYGRAAAGTFLMSAFLPNTLNAQTTDSINFTIANTLTINTSVFSSSVMNGSVVQPDSAGKHIKRIEFSIDTFHLVFDINTNTAFSFQVPQQYIGDSINVELRLADESTQSLKIGGTNTFMNAWYYRSSLCFVNNNARWTSQIIVQQTPEIITLGGISPYTEFEPIKIDWPSTLTFGYASEMDSNVNIIKDTIVEPALYKQADYIKIKSNKSHTKSSAWPWYLLIGLVGLVIAFFKFRKPRKPLTKETNPSNPDSEEGNAIN